MALDPNPIAAAVVIAKACGNAWGEYRQEKQIDKIKGELQAAANIVSFDEAKQQANAAAKEATADPVLQEQIERIITLYPASIRTTFRRKDDPSGRTVPDDFVLRDEQDLVRLSPVRLPRFKSGDTPHFLRGWRLMEQIGAGGFGEVWKVQKLTATNLIGAIKFGHALSETERSMINENDVLNRLLAEGEHEGIVPLLDCWNEGDEVPWLRFKYIDGGDLTGLIHRMKRMERPQRAEQARLALGQLAKTAGYFHTLKDGNGKADPIVHRDLKPSNILFDEKSKKLLIADFGIGAVSSKRSIDAERELGRVSQGAVIATYLRGSHTPLYASPQQRSGSVDLDPRDDVHALCVIGYQMLTGNLDAAPGGDMGEELADLDVPDDLIRVLKRGVSRDPNKRPANGMELAAELGKSPTIATVAPVPLVPATPVAPIPIAKRVATLQPGDRKEIDLGGGVKMAFAYCPPGTFRMGSPSSEENRGTDELLHKVTHTRGYYTGIHPVTVGQFKRFVAETHYITEAESGGGGHKFVDGAWKLSADCDWHNPGFAQRDDHPVVVVSWNDAQAFAKWVCTQTKTPVRLLSEAEWEYAARGGTTTPFYFGKELNGKQANCDGNYPYGTTEKGPYLKGTSTVGSYSAKFPHPWGLCDVIGNVWEWCEDWYDAEFYKRSPETDPQCQDCEHKYKLLRGGSWSSYAHVCRSAVRHGIEPSRRSIGVGFRLCSPCT